MHTYETSYDMRHRHQVDVPPPPPGATQLALQTTRDRGHRHGITLPAQALRQGRGVQKWTTYDKGHRHTLTIPPGGRAHLSGFGQDPPGMPQLPPELPGGYLSPEACAQRVAETQQAERAEGQKTASMYGVVGAVVGLAAGALIGWRML